MSRGLAIETSGRIGSVAIVEEGRVVAEDTFAHGLQHAAEMIPRIDALLRQQGWTPADLRELYVSAGPGSFTGLRIGITLAKTVAFATGAIIAAVPTVEVLAHNAPPEARNVVIVLDAKREQIYTARLSRAGDGGDWHLDEAAHLDSLAEMIQRAPRPVHLIGEGIAFHQKHLPADDAGVILTPPESWRARAGVVASIGYRMLREGLVTDPQQLAPTYIRRPEAEEKWEAKDHQRKNR